MNLETERLILRPWREDDAADLYEYAKDGRVGPAAGWQPHTSEEESLGIIRNVLSKPESYAVCLKETGKPVGCISFETGNDAAWQLPSDEAELGFWIGVPFWGKGLMPEAVNAMLRRGFTELGFSTVWCAYFDGNAQSRCVQEKCGFTFHHTNRDVYWARLGTVFTEHVNRLTKEEWERAEEKPRSVIDRLTLLYIKEGRILTARSKGKTAWYLPGGKREKGETDLEALSREVKEELSAELVPGTVSLFGVFEGQAHGKPEGTVVRLACYTAELAGTPSPSSEVEELRFFSGADLPDVPPADRAVYAALLARGLI